jgi:hypothetical protein
VPQKRSGSAALATVECACTRLASMAMIPLQAMPGSSDGSTAGQGRPATSAGFRLHELALLVLAVLLGLLTAGVMVCHGKTLVSVDDRHQGMYSMLAVSLALCALAALLLQPGGFHLPWCHAGMLLSLFLVYAQLVWLALVVLLAYQAVRLHAALSALERHLLAWGLPAALTSGHVVLGAMDSSSTLGTLPTGYCGLGGNQPYLAAAALGLGAVVVASQLAALAHARRRESRTRRSLATEKWDRHLNVAHVHLAGVALLLLLLAGGWGTLFYSFQSHTQAALLRTVGTAAVAGAGFWLFLLACVFNADVQLALAMRLGLADSLPTTAESEDSASRSLPKRKLSDANLLLTGSIAMGMVSRDGSYQWPAALAAPASPTAAEARQGRKGRSAFPRGIPEELLWDSQGEQLSAVREEEQQVLALDAGQEANGGTRRVKPRAEARLLADTAAVQSPAPPLQSNGSALAPKATLRFPWDTGLDSCVDDVNFEGELYAASSASGSVRSEASLRLPKGTLRRPPLPSFALAGTAAAAQQVPPRPPKEPEGSELVPGLAQEPPKATVPVRPKVAPKPPARPAPPPVTEDA